MHADPRPCRALFVDGPLDGEAHDVPHGDVEWRAVRPPEAELPPGTTVDPSQLPRDRYVREHDPCGVVDEDGRPIYRYRYAGEVQP